MGEVKDRISINRYAKKETRRNGAGFETSWYLRISRLYSGGYYYEREYKTENIFDERTYTYDTNSLNPIRQWKEGQATRMHIYSGRRFVIAVKELIIEWEDYQTEVSGYVHCKSCSDLVEKSELFHHTSEISVDDEYKFENNTKQLLRFVKSPGLRYTNITIQKEDLEFFPIDLNHCDTVSIQEKLDHFNLEVRREHCLECELRPLFDNEHLPIKHAHITVEVYLQ